MSDRTRLVAVTGMSNVTGTVPPLSGIIELARSRRACWLTPPTYHHRLDVSRLGAGFVAFSGHKMCGPTGIGVLYAKRELLESMPPVFLAALVTRVGRDRADLNELPWKFEAGTPPIAEAIGLGAAMIISTGLTRHLWRPMSELWSAMPMRFWCGSTA